MDESEVNKYFEMDFLKLIKKVNKFKKNINFEKYSLKVALIGTGSLQFFADILQYELYLNGIETDIFIGTYNGLEVDVLDCKSDFYKFKADITIIFSHYREVKDFPDLFSNYAEMCKMVKNKVKHLATFWEKIHYATGSQVFQTNYVIPLERQLGNLESNYAWSHQSFLQSINWEMMCLKPGYVTIIDFEYLASYMGKRRWFDNKNYYLNKCNMSYDCLPLASKEILMNILNCRGFTKKCIVLDLDNTLWGGTLEERGIKGINLDPNDPVGEAFIYFQKYLKMLKDRGVILAVCSKNDEQYAKRVFTENSNMILKLEDISCFIANWSEKHINVKRIADTLNLGLSSFVFVDDNKVERELIKSTLPDVEVVDIGDDPSEYVTKIESGMYFEWLQVTEEDLLRTETYSNQFIINEDSDADAILYDDYLTALNMTAQIGELDCFTIPRIVQLFNKTNQFNSTGYRCTEGNIADAKEKGKNIYWCRLSDRYNKYGIVSCFIVDFNKRECVIEAWCMSCRVFKRGLEQLIINYLIEEAIKRGCSTLNFLYTKTERNHLVKEVLLSCGMFKKEVSDNTESFLFDIEKHEKLPNFISLINEEVYE